MKMLYNKSTVLFILSKSVQKLLRNKQKKTVHEASDFVCARYSKSHVI